MFLNRRRELEQLEADYKLPTSTMVFLFGRKQVGKTTLINEYTKNKDTIYLSCIEILPKLLFENFTSIISKYFNQSMAQTASLSTFLDILSSCDIKRKTVIVLDDFQNLTKIEKEALSILSKQWNKKLKQKNIQLIISSSINSSLPEDRKVYESANVQIILKSLNFTVIKDIIKDVSKNDLMYIYASLGTNIKYLEQYNIKKDFVLNLKEIFLNPNSDIFHDGLNIVKNDLSEIGTYSSILYAIAKGNSKIGDIASFLDVKSSYLTRYLQKLVDMMIIAKQVPITDDPSKSKFGRYKIEDNYLKFWFAYIYPNMSQLNKHDTYSVLNQIRTTYSKQMVHPAYKNYIFELISNSPEQFLTFTPTKIGRWWNNKDKEIDIVAYNNSEITFIDCKWRTKETASQSYEILKQKSRLFDTVLNKNFIIFSKTAH